MQSKSLFGGKMSSMCFEYFNTSPGLSSLSCLTFQWPFKNEFTNYKLLWPNLVTATQCFCILASFPGRSWPLGKLLHRWWTKPKYTLHSENSISLFELKKGARLFLTFKLKKLNAFLKAALLWFCHNLKQIDKIYSLEKRNKITRLVFREYISIHFIKLC